MIINQSTEELKDNLISQLKTFEKELGHSPKRRDIPALAAKCYNYFGSFNEAKKKAGLSIRNVQINQFPKNAFRIDKDLAQIASYLTFDGHLYKDLKGMMYSSKNIYDLERFEEVIRRKFGLPARYHLYSAGSRGQTHKIYFFNKKVCEYLLKKGVPKGDKVIQEFDVPDWISCSKNLSREYLKIAYLCEGSMKEKDRKTPRISFIHAKCVDILDSGVKFIDTLKMMLGKFDINTGSCYISKERIRKKDNKRVNDLRFRIKTEDNHKFIREIGWLK